MVAQEAGTSPASKQLIVATAGLLDSEWDQTYDGAYNGVTTVTSEYGEMNHMLATRGVMFIREMFDTILNQPREKREALLLERKDEIISRLNNDYMRPWFGQKTDGRVVDLEEMTYTEVISRAVKLMYVAHQQRWTNASFCKFVIDFVDRVERRMCITAPETPLSAELFDADPREWHTRVSERYPKSVSQLLTSEDVQFFVSLCKRRGQKPPPFIPVLDVDFGVLFMKDMTWQPDDLDSVIDQDPQRVCIQQGPVAVQYSTIVDEPVKDILDGIYHGHIASLVQRLHDGDESRIPVVEYIGAEPVTAALSESLDVCETETERVFVLPTQADRLPELDTWMQMLAGPHKSWLHALVTAPVIVQGSKYADNYTRKLLRARPGRTATVHLESGLPSLLTITNADGELELTTKCDADRTVRLTIYHKSLNSVVVPFSLEFTYNPSQNLTPIHGSKQRDNESVRQLCIDTWVANADDLTPFVDVVDPNTVVKSSFTITEEHSRGFCESVGNQAWQYTFARDGILQAPMEYAHIVFTRDMLRLLQSSVFGFGQVNGVHMYNDVTLEDGARMFQVDDELAVTATMNGLTNLRSGKKIKLNWIVERGGKKVATIESAFVVRSHYIDIGNAFERYPQQLITIVLPSAADIAALELNEWFIYCEDTAATLKPNAPI
ncbi:fatty acid synthase alpha subunit Lsd1, partial [Coemansia sp. RSA 1853]